MRHRNCPAKVSGTCSGISRAKKVRNAAIENGTRQGSKERKQDRQKERQKESSNNSRRQKQINQNWLGVLLLQKLHNGPGSSGSSSGSIINTINTIESSTCGKKPESQRRLRLRRRRRRQCRASSTLVIWPQFPFNISALQQLLQWRSQKRPLSQPPALSKSLPLSPALSLCLREPEHVKFRQSAAAAQAAFVTTFPALIKEAQC